MLEGAGHVFLTCGKIKGQVHPVTSHEGTEGKGKSRSIARPICDHSTRWGRVLTCAAVLRVKVSAFVVRVMWQLI
jgi:hypothetical protein